MIHHLQQPLQVFMEQVFLFFNIHKKLKCCLVLSIRNFNKIPFHQIYQISYTSILPAKDVKHEPTRIIPYIIDESCDKDIVGISDWLKKLDFIKFGNNDDQLSFAAYFSQDSSTKMPRTSSTFLPLINESINSTATVQQCMSIIGKLTSHLNPGQFNVITDDQPVCALGKQVQ